MCGPRADSGEKPSKASQAVANLDSCLSPGRDAAARRLRLRFWTSAGPVAVSFFGRGREKIMNTHVGVRGRREGRKERTGPLDEHV